MVCWCVGVLVCWCVGVLVCWCAGVLVCWCVGVLVCWCVGVCVVSERSFDALYLPSPVPGTSTGTGNKPQPQSLHLSGLVCVAASGILIASCSATHSLYAFDPSDSAIGAADPPLWQWLCGGGQFGDGADGFCDARSTDESERKGVRFFQPRGIAVDEPNRVLMVCDTRNRVIRRVKLPDALFVSNSDYHYR